MQHSTVGIIFSCAKTSSSRGRELMGATGISNRQFSLNFMGYGLESAVRAASNFITCNETFQYNVPVFEAI
jgi:hypothetical protein